MPIYMDRHHLPGVSAEDIARAHVADLAIQEEFGCTGMTYWLDEERECAFCLIKAPDEKAVHEMHAKAHGFVPNEIMEVDSELVKAFLGRIQDPDPSHPKDANGLYVFSDPAYRAIMMVSIRNSPLLKSLYGERVKNLIEGHFNRIVLEGIRNFGGQVVEQYEEFLASFPSITDAVECADYIAKNTRIQLQKAELPAVEMAAGISAGQPVEEKDRLFGDAVETARILCSFPIPGVIRTTSVVRELYRGECTQVFNRTSQIHVLGAEEEFFLKRLSGELSSMIEDGNFSVVELGNRLNVSKSKLYRMTREITGKSPSELIMESRLLKSLELMEKMRKNISEVSYGLEFSNPSYFSKCFRKKFRILPTEFLNSL